MCPRCHKEDCQEIRRSKDDNIDNLDHSHMKCNICGYQFNVWHESTLKLKEVFGDSYELYAVKTMGL